MAGRSQSLRRVKNRVVMMLSAACAMLGLLVLAAVLWSLLSQGLAGINLALFTQPTPGPGGEGGLGNAIVGSVLITLIGIAAAVPVGVLAGTYLAEYGRQDRLARGVRFVNDVLLSAPSILVGLFVYQLLVVPAGGFSGWAGAAALAVIALPILVRTTEDMLTLVPGELREAAAALGTPQWRVITQICYRAALRGMVTGVLLALARISGETAPLLFTTLNNSFWSLDLSKPMANLPVTIFRFAMSPYDEWNRLAWSGALLITLTILALSVVARIMLDSRR
jgi:phosphate transport system permease protein